MLLTCSSDVTGGGFLGVVPVLLTCSSDITGGGSLGVVPLNTKGRFDSNAPLLHGHSDLITDFDFSPFDDGMLATGSTDANVRVQLYIYLA